MGSPRPGWYGDPEGGGGKRYWDGTEWTVRRSSLTNTIIALVIGGVALAFSLLLVGTILTEDCTRDGMQYVCESGNVETTVNIPILAVVGPASVVMVLGAVAGIVSWIRAGRRAHPSTGSARTADAPPPPAPATGTPTTPVPPAPRAAHPTDTTPPPPPPAVAPTPALGVAALEEAVRASVAAPDGGTKARERVRIDAVTSLGALARFGSPERDAAVAALLRLLAVDTGFQPELQIGAAKRTMRHAVIEQLGESGDPAAVEPLCDFLDAQTERYLAVASGTSSGSPLEEATLAEDLIKTTATALGRLGDPRALDHLAAAEHELHFGMKKAAKKAQQEIRAGRRASA